MSKLRSSRAERETTVGVNNYYLDNPEAGMTLIASLIAMPESKNELTEALGRLEKLIKYDFLAICSLENMPDEAEAFVRLQAAYDHLEDLTEFSALANKNVVAIGGSFSAGKSRFLNSLLRDNILPTDTTPTTAIPTYIASAEEESIHAINSFNLKVPLEREAVKAISHAFNQKYNVSFSHIIKVLTVGKPSFSYSNIAFLDTPGYSKSDSLVKGDKTDERIAFESLKSADYLIWLVDATKGTLPDSDLQFIKQLDFPQPIFMVFNKADLRLPAEVDKMVRDTGERLKDMGISSAGIIAYNSSASENNEIGGQKLKVFLEDVNRRVKCTTIKQEFDRVFEAFLQYNHHEMVETSETLTLLNHLYLKMEELPSTMQTDLKKLITKGQQKVKRNKQVIASFQALLKRMLDIIEEITAGLQLQEENLEDRGIVGIGVVRAEKTLAKLKEEERIMATITKISAFGVSLDCGLGDSVLLSIDDIRDKYTNPVAELFQPGQQLEVEIIEINRVTKEIKLIARI